MNKMREPLSPEEYRRVRGTIKTFMALGVIMAIVLIIMWVVGFNAENNHIDAFGILFPFLMIAFIYLYTSRHYVLFPADLKVNQKIVASTTVLRKKKRGWFDMDARGGLSNVMMGSACYIYIPDESKHSGERRFRVLMDAYETLQPGDKIRVAWLPKSGQILSIDMPDFHWVAWDRRPGDHG